MQQVVLLAQRTRQEVERAGLQITDFSGIARKFGIQFEWGQLPISEDGSYAKDERKIVLNSRITNFERRNFSFCHEFMHDCIEHDDDFLSLFADAYIQQESEYDTMEQLCNSGAAELLIPSEEIRTLIQRDGFSITLIPQFCELFGASSIAVAFQMVSCATHNCYLVIVEMHNMQPEIRHNQPLLFEAKTPVDTQGQLLIIYSSASSSAKYSIKRNQVIPTNHLLYEALHTSETVSGEAKLPFASGKGWLVQCEAMCFRGKVFAFFNVEQPISNLQMRLF